MNIYNNINKDLDIKTIKEWGKECPPEKKDHWKKGKSSYSLAKYWTEQKDKAIKNIKDLISSNLQILYDKICLIEAYPEFETRFDNFGKGRIHDLLIKGKINNKDIIIGIEGKVNESFNDKIVDIIIQGIIKKIKYENTNIIKRIENILKNIFGNKINEKHFNLRYQLLYSLFGTFKEAILNNSEMCFLIIQKFITSELDENKSISNDKDLLTFINYIGNTNYNILELNKLYEPFILKEKDKNKKKPKIYIGQSEIMF